MHVYKTTQPPFLAEVMPEETRRMGEVTLAHAVAGLEIEPRFIVSLRIGETRDLIAALSQSSDPVARKIADELEVRLAGG